MDGITLSDREVREEPRIAACSPTWPTPAAMDAVPKDCSAPCRAVVAAAAAPGLATARSGEVIPGARVGTAPSSAAAADADEEGVDDVVVLLLGQGAGVGVDQDDGLAGAVGGGEGVAEVAVEAALVAP